MSTVESKHFSVGGCESASWSLLVRAVQVWTLSDGDQYRLIPSAASAEPEPESSFPNVEMMEDFASRSRKKTLARVMKGHRYMAMYASTPPTRVSTELCLVGRVGKKAATVMKVETGGCHRAVWITRLSSQVWSTHVCGTTAEELESCILDVLEAYAGLSVTSRPEGAMYRESHDFLRGPGKGCEYTSDARSWKMSDGSRCFPSMVRKSTSDYCPEHLRDEFAILRRGAIVMYVWLPAGNCGSHKTCHPREHGLHKVSFPDDRPDIYPREETAEEIDSAICRALEECLQLTVKSRPTHKPYIRLQEPESAAASSKLTPGLLLSQIHRLEKASAGATGAQDAPPAASADCGCGEWRPRISSKQTWMLSDGREYCLTPPLPVAKGINITAAGPFIAYLSNPTQFFLSQSGKDIVLLSVRYDGPHLRIVITHACFWTRTDYWQDGFDICGRTPEDLDSSILETLEGITGLSVVSRPAGTIYERPGTRPSGDYDWDSQRPYLDSRSWVMSDRSRCFPCQARRPRPGRSNGLCAKPELVVLRHGAVVMAVRPLAKDNTHRISFPGGGSRLPIDFSAQSHEELDTHVCNTLQQCLQLEIVSHPVNVPYTHNSPKARTTSGLAPDLLLSHVKRLEEKSSRHTPPKHAAAAPQKRTAARAPPPPPVLDLASDGDDDKIVREMRAARKQERKDALRASTQERQFYDCEACTAARTPIDPDSDRVLASCSAGCELHFHMACSKKNRVRLHSDCRCGGVVVAVHRWRRGKRVHSATAAAGMHSATAAAGMHSATAAASMAPPLPGVPEGPLQPVAIPSPATVLPTSPPPPPLPVTVLPTSPPRLDRPVVPVRPPPAFHVLTPVAATPARRRRRRRGTADAVNLVDLKREFERMNAAKTGPTS